MGNYKFVEFVYCQLDVNHIPYFMYAVISGPRGGQYLLDEFNTERLLKKLITRIDPSIIGGFKNSVIRRMTKDSVVKVVYLQNSYSEEELKQVAASNNQKPLIRKDGVAIVNKMAENFNDSQINFMEQEFRQHEYDMSRTRN